MKRNNADRVLNERLRAGRKAWKYVRSKSGEMQTFISNYLKFPDVISPMDFIDQTLKKDNNL